jgi:hypothetical protein
MSFLGRMIGRRSKTDIAQEITQRLMRIVVGLMADNAFSAAAPEIAAYLRDKDTPDLINGIDGCDDLLARLRGPMPMMNPEVMLNVREALANELKRRGLRVAQSPLTIADFDLSPKEIDFTRP